MTTNNYSLWRLLDKLYNAKRDYYVKGHPSITDEEYEGLETSIKAIHGGDLFEKHTCVGYDNLKHTEIRINLDLLR